MKIGKQVTTLELSKRLKDLGIEQKSIFYWNKAKSELHPEYVALCWNSNVIACAFTVWELSQMIGRDEGQEALRTAIEERMNSSHSFMLLFSPSFLANCIIGIIEHKILTVEEINERMNKNE